MKVYRRQSRKARPEDLERLAVVEKLAARDWRNRAGQQATVRVSRPPPASRYLAIVIAPLLVVTLAHRLATPDAGTMATPTAVEPPAVASRSVRIIRPTTAPTFGEASRERPAPTAPKPISAPHTMLAIDLTGVLLGGDGLPSTAIIAADDGSARAYGVGESIANADGATLHALYPDRAILDRGNRLETLPLNSAVGEATTPQFSAALGRSSNEPQVPSGPAADPAP